MATLAEQYPDLEEINFALPNGNTILLPIGSTQAQIYDAALAQELITTQEINAAGTTLGDRDWTKKTEDMVKGLGDWTIKNLEVPGAIGGGLAGAAIGTAITPGVGTVVGSIIGAAVGSAGGSIGSDVVSDQEVDWEEAGKEAAISLGIDAVTFGTGKFIRPVFRSLGFGTKEADALIKNSLTREALPAGDLASLQQTQNLLTGGGGSLSIFQTQRASSFATIVESITDLGLVAGQRTARRQARNSLAIQEEVVKLLDNTFSNEVLGANELGAAVHGVISAGKQALNDQYGKGILDIQQRLANKQVSVGPLVKTLRLFQEEGRREFGSTYNPQTIKMVDEFLDSLSGLKSMRATSLLDFEKKIGQSISDAGSFGTPTFNTHVERELGTLSGKVRNTLEETLQKVGPQISTDYRALNKTYAIARDRLLPTINNRFIKNGDKGDYFQLGNMLIGTKNVDQVRAALTSVDAAFAQLRKSGEELPAGIKTASDAKDAIRQGYVSNLMPDFADESFSLLRYQELATRLERGNAAAAAQAVLGPDFGRFKALVNAMSEASKKPDSLMGGLVLRGREAGAITKAGSSFTNTGLLTGAAGTVGGMAGGVVGGALGVAAILGIPVVAARIVSNPRAVNQLLTLQRESIKKTYTPEQLASAFSKILAENLSDDDKLHIRHAIREAESNTAN